jgi:hypothetical protein
MLNSSEKLHPAQELSRSIASANAISLVKFLAFLFIIFLRLFLFSRIGKLLGLIIIQSKALVNVKIGKIRKKKFANLLLNDACAVDRIAQI